MLTLLVGCKAWENWDDIVIVIVGYTTMQLHA